VILQKTWELWEKNVVKKKHGVYDVLPGKTWVRRNYANASPSFAWGFVT
jgi:hypothetical protein